MKRIDPEAALPYLIALWTDVTDAELRCEAGLSLLRGGTPRGRHTLSADVEAHCREPVPPGADRVGREILAVRLAATLLDDPARAFDRLSPFLLTCEGTSPSPREQALAEMLYALVDFAEGRGKSSSLAAVGMILEDQECRLDQRWKPLIAAVFRPLDPRLLPPELQDLAVVCWQPRPRDDQ